MATAALLLLFIQGLLAASIALHYLANRVLRGLQ
jgi:hypothetical protein